MPHPSLALFVVIGLAGCSCSGPAYKAGLRQVPAVPAEIRYSEAHFQGARGIELLERGWAPGTDEPRAALVVMHGLKDHGDRYGDLALALVRRGFAVYAFDLRGHGDSAGEREWVDSFDDYVSDLDTYVRAIQSRVRGRPVFLLGHSMGGAIATLAVLEKQTPVSGLVLSAPALKPGKDVNGFLIWVTGVLGSATPRAGVLDLPADRFSRDPAVLAAMKADPLIVQGAGPAKTAKELLGALETIGKRMDELTVPLLVMHGTDDAITNPEGSSELVRRARSSDKTLKLYEKLYHDLLHEPEKDLVVADIAGWLDARASGPGLTQAGATHP